MWLKSNSSKVYLAPSASNPSDHCHWRNEKASKPGFLVFERTWYAPPMNFTGYKPSTRMD
jgi:hypothetical protein